MANNSQENDNVFESDSGRLAPAVQEIASLSLVFSLALETLNKIASQQSRGILAVAIAASETAQSLYSTRARVTGVSADDIAPGEEFSHLLTRLKEASDKYLNSQIALEELSASIEKRAEARQPSEEVSTDSVLSLLNQTYANTISNLNLAQQNAISNQRAMNEIGLAVLARSVSLILSLATAGNQAHAGRG